MENKTLSHLNSKAWYRLLKVAFIVAFVIVLASYNFFVFSGGIKKVDQNKTTIKCNVFGRHLSLLPAFNVSLSAPDFQNGQFNYKGYFEGYNNDAIMTILKGCGNFTLAFAGAG